MNHNHIRTLIGAAGAFALASLANAVPTFFGPSPYLSSADIPAGLYAGGIPTFLENFEDGTLDGGITATGVMQGPGGITDSVDADDGSIDGLGTNGRSRFGGGTITFTFPAGTTAAGVVWTDGAGLVGFEAFGPSGSLGIIQGFNHPDGGITGTTAEDRFYGVSDPNGITSIRIFNTAGGTEADHVQYGQAFTPGTPGVPDPASTLPLLGLALAGLALFARRRASV